MCGSETIEGQIKNFVILIYCSVSAQQQQQQQQQGVTLSMTASLTGFLLFTYLFTPGVDPTKL